MNTVMRVLMGLCIATAGVLIGSLIAATVQVKPPEPPPGPCRDAWYYVTGGGCHYSGECPHVEQRLEVVSNGEMLCLCPRASATGDSEKR